MERGRLKTFQTASFDIVCRVYAAGTHAVLGLQKLLGLY